MAKFTYVAYSQLAANGGYNYVNFTPSKAVKVFKVNVSSSVGPVRAELKYGLTSQQTNIAVLNTSDKNPNAEYVFCNDFMLDNTTLLGVTITNTHSAPNDAWVTIQHSDC